MSEKEAISQPKTIFIGFTIIVFVVSLVVIYAIALLYFTWPIDELSLDKSGVFGDSFGLLTALFSGLAFGGLIIAILLQKEDLGLQREELRLNREELRLNREELQLSRKEMKIQNFENTFFQMLRLHNEIVSGIDLSKDRPTGPVLTTGRDCFTAFTTRLGKIFNVLVTKEDYDPKSLDTVSTAYDKFWKINQQELGHYFRYLYRIYRFVNESENAKKSFYTGIIRAQLSDRELLLLFYNCLSRNGLLKFKPLAEKYALFDNLPSNTLFDQSHMSLYKTSAWGGQTMLEETEMP